MRTFERMADLLGPALSTLLRATRRVTLIVASLAVAVTACGPVGVAGPGLPGADPTEDVADPDPATDARDSWLPDADGPNGAPEDPPIRAPDCQRAGPMVPC
jgi:hypothetical protein